jgi:hypothetical protein
LYFVVPWLVLLTRTCALYPSHDFVDKLFLWLILLVSPDPDVSGLKFMFVHK